MRTSKTMDRIARCWLWLGKKIHRRPLAVMGLLLGATVWVGLMIWLFIETDRTRNDIREVQVALCGGRTARIENGELTPEVRANCQLLFNRIWDSATPEQISKAKKRLAESP